MYRPDELIWSLKDALPCDNRTADDNNKNNLQESAMHPFTRFVAVLQRRLIAYLFIIAAVVLAAGAPFDPSYHRC